MRATGVTVPRTIPDAVALLLQAVDRTSEIVTYVLVVTYPGPDGGHEFVPYPGTAGTLTEPTPEGDPATVGQWAVRTAYGLFDDWSSGTGRSRRGKA